MFKLAIRNIWRNPKRSFITIGAIVVGLWGLIFLWSFVDGMNEQMIVNNIQYITGHLKIHRSGFHDSDQLALSLSDDDSKITDALQQVDVKSKTPRIEATALVSSNKESDTVMVFGVDPSSEKSLSAFDEAIIAGQYLASELATPSSDTLRWEIVIGDKLAQKLQVSIGDEIDLVVQAADGSIGADRFRISGVFDSGIDMLDGKLVLITIPAAQELYSLWGQYTAWLLNFENRQSLPMQQAMLENQLGQQYEVLDWESLLPSVVQTIVFHERITYIVIFVVFIVVAAGIANTILMSVMERTREFGIMLALGTHDQQVLTMVIVESILLGVIGLIAGVLIGIGFTSYWTQHGIDLGHFTQAMETMPGLSAVVYPVLRVDHIAVVAFVVLLVCVLPAILPAWRSSHLKPVDAIRGVVGQDNIASKLEQSFPLPGADRARFFHIAWRNLFRNLKRSALTTAAIAFGMGAFVFLYAFADGFFEQMTENSTKLITAHVQIKPQPTSSDNGLDYLNADQIEAVVKQFQNQYGKTIAIQSWTPRIVSEAIVSSSSKTVPIEWYGIDPVQEVSVTDIHTLIVEGRYLDQNDYNSVVVGKGLADELGVQVGNKIILTLQKRDGDLVSAALRIKGIFNTGSDLIDKGYLFSPFGDQENLLGLAENEFSHVAIKLENRHQSIQAAHLFNQMILNGDTASLSQNLNLEAESWEQIMPVLVQMIDMSRIDFYLILAVVFIVVVMGVMNTLLMSVLERIREFGMLLALGTLPSQVLRVVLYEAAVLTTVGIVMGGAVGSLIAQYFHVAGIGLSGLGQALVDIPGLTDKVYPTLFLENLVTPTLILFTLSVVVALYPARKAAYMAPVEALHHA